MNTTHTLETLFEAVQKTAEQRKDYLLPTSKVSAEVLHPHPEVEGESARLLLSFNDAGYRINRNASRQLCTHYKMGQKYYDLMQGQALPLLATNLNWWFEQADSRRMFRTLDDTVRAFLSPNYRRIDNVDVMARAVLPALKDFAGLHYEGSAVTEDYMNFKVFWPSSEQAVAPGDVIWAGVEVKNSEVGSSALHVRAVTRRLICTNGAKHNAYGQRYQHRTVTQTSDAAQLYLMDSTKRKEDDAFLDGVRDVVSGVLRGQWLKQVVEQMQFANGLELASPSAAIELLTNDHALTDTESKSIFDAFLKEQNTSAWGLVNSITQIANTHESYDRAQELEEIGGNLLANPRKLQRLATVNN